jgi:hypothetical protein
LIVSIVSRLLMQKGLGPMGNLKTMSLGSTGSGITNDFGKSDIGR